MIINKFVYLKKMLKNAKEVYEKKKKTLRAKVWIPDHHPFNYRGIGD